LLKKTDYEPPGIGTVFQTMSKFARADKLVLIKRLASLVGNNDLIIEKAEPSSHDRVLRVRLNDYLDKCPIRKHKKHWIDTGEQIAVFHPVRSVPFFLNKFASIICRFCNGENNIRDMIVWSRKEWPLLSKQIIDKDIMKFLLLLEELDLIRFIG